MADRAFRIHLIRRKDKKRHELAQRQAGTIVLAPTVPLHGPYHPLQMTLLANAFAQLRVQALGIDNGIVHAPLATQVIAFPKANTKLPATMTAFAADAVSLKYRSTEMVQRAVNRLGSIR